MTNLRTGAAVALHPGRRLPDARPGIDAWDPYDTVFKVETSRTPRRHLPGTLDHRDRDGLHARLRRLQPRGRQLPQPTGTPTATFPSRSPSTSARQAPRPILALNQREWSPTYNRETFGRAEDSSRIKDYTVEVSDDGRTWTPVKTAHDAERTRDPVHRPRRSPYAPRPSDGPEHVGVPTVTAFYNKLAIDELHVVGRDVKG